LLNKKPVKPMLCECELSELLISFCKNSKFTASDASVGMATFLI
jgi:hypothetical protein